MVSQSRRVSDIRRAQVWMPTNIASMDVRTGPPSPGGFAPDASVSCEYVDKPLKGRSPKFSCSLGEHDEVKVKYGRSNGEVYAEVAATRLLWALGFGADHMYPVRIECRGCPPSFRGPPRHGERPVIVMPATIERKMPGRAIETHEESGWAWPELELVDEHAGGAPRAQVDALRLLAAFIQHTDSKPAQQRLVCLVPAGADEDGTCRQPFMMLNDVGQTFGHANRFNRDVPGSVNFEEWSRTPVWSDPKRCVANISKSITGTLNHPAIGEAGRKFLADLMAQLSDTQLHDLFDVAHFEMRSGHRSDEWVEAFKRKRAEILNQTCEGFPRDRVEMTVPNADRAIIAADKLAAYLLNMSHKRGAAKARLLLGLGYRFDAAHVLGSDLRAQHLALEVTRTHENPYGVVYEVEGPIKTPSGKSVAKFWLTSLAGAENAVLPPSS